MGHHLARMRQTLVEGEVAAVTLELISNDAIVDLKNGDAFYTVILAIDPWAPDA